MSTCISRHGEYSDHEYGSDPFTCDLCGAFAEDEAIAELDRLRTERDDWKAAWKKMHDESFLPARAALRSTEARLEQAEADLATVRDTLEKRTQSHAALVRTRLACPTCSTLPLEETPGE